MKDSLSWKKGMQHTLKGSLLLATTLVLLTAAGNAFAGETPPVDPVADALKSDWGQIKLNLRYRWEHVNQDGLKTTNGDPIRLRLGYLTPKFAGFQAFAQFEGSTPIFDDDYNDKSNGKTDYAVIADPSKGELNQGWLSFDTIPETVVKAGRQKILLDNQRFVGAVGWRQMEQTFDAVDLLNTSLGAFTADISYVWNARTIFSEDVNMSSPLVNLQYSFAGIGSLTGYGYFLDYDDAGDSGPFTYAFSTQTLGLRFNGKAAVADNLNLIYTAEYAGQSDYQDNTADYRADYYHFIGGLVLPGSGSILTNITGKIGYEVLGSDNGVSFKTPLGTNHGFNGWADLFLTAPPEGLQDLYGSVSASLSGYTLALFYHDFQADEGGADYGTEFDAKLTKKFAGHYSLDATYASYNADEFKTDTEKFWLAVTVAY
jgi:hypothetical protein